MTNALEAIVEILSWIGLGAGLVVAVAALLARAADGTWVPARGFIEHEASGPVIRWFDEDGQANEAVLSAAERHALPGGDTADIYIRRGSRNRMRLAAHSPLVRGLALLAGVLLGVGLLALIVSILLLFMS